MIRGASDPVWEKLIKGELNVTIKLVPAQLLLNRCKRNLNNDPSPANLKAMKTDCYNFFAKFENILKDEIKQIFG
jgi:hypothetical protein